MNTWSAAVAFAVAAAGFHAVAAVVQNQLGGRPGRRRGVLAALAQRLWWLAVGLTVFAASLHVTALHFGPLTVVQPLGILSLVFALALSAGLTGRRVTRPQWRGLALSMTGLTCVVLLTAAGRPRNGLSPAEVAVLAVATVTVVVTAVAVASTLTMRPVRRSLCYAAAAGTTFGVSSALTQTVTIRVADSGLRAVLTPATALVVAFAVAGLLLSHAAFRADLAASLAAATIVNPAVAAAIGVGLLGERFAGGPATMAAATLAGGVAAWGVVLLAKNSRAAAVAPVTADLTMTPSRAA